MPESIAALASMFFGAKLKGAVEHAGYEYKGAIGKEGLLNAIQSNKPSVVLVDLSKDDINFNEVIKSIQSCTDAPIL